MASRAKAGQIAEKVTPTTRSHGTPSVRNQDGQSPPVHHDVSHNAAKSATANPESANDVAGVTAGDSLLGSTLLLAVRDDHGGVDMHGGQQSHVNVLTGVPRPT